MNPLVVWSILVVTFSRQHKFERNTAMVRQAREELAWLEPPQPRKPHRDQQRADPAAGEGDAPVVR